MNLLNALLISAGYLAGNYAYQLLQAVPDWKVANMKSLDQGMALLLVLIMTKVIEKMIPNKEVVVATLKAKRDAQIKAEVTELRYRIINNLKTTSSFTLDVSSSSNEAITLITKELKEAGYSVKYVGWKWLEIS